MDLFTALQNFTYTENGALTHSTTGSRVLDLFAQGGAFRKRSESDIRKAVSDAFVENPLLTVETLIYLRDIRGGQGEKRVFQIGIQTLKDTVFKATQSYTALFDTMVEVGCWKDIFKVFTFDEWKSYVYTKIKSGDDKPNLMYKWLPSIGGSQNKLAEQLASYLGMTPREYRKMLTAQRAKLKLVETAMCSNDWGNIDYGHIPSRAGLIYRPAFKKHDSNRYDQFIKAVLEGKDDKVKINTGTLYPYEIVEKYLQGLSWYDMSRSLTVKPDLEAFWKSLPVFGDSAKNALVVADTSGSMYGRPLNVATSLAIYFAQHNTGLFHNKWVTFSRKPTFYSFTDNSSLAEILYPFVTLNICENTDLQAVFDLVLKAAVTGKIPQSEMPESVIIISDMEFDSCTGPKTNFDTIKDKYARAEYEMPHLVFWNVNSRQDNLPVQANEQGVTLVSGAAASTFDMVIAHESDPYNFMVKVVTQPRYEEPAKRILGL